MADVQDERRARDARRRALDLVSDDELVRAMRTFEQLAGVLRYPEAQKWHTRDIMGMRAVLAEFAALREPSGYRAGAEARDDVVEARLTAWQEGYGGVDIRFASGRRCAIALGKPHGPADVVLARQVRLGPSFRLGNLVDRVYASLLDGPKHISEFYGLATPDETRKQVWNAVSYLKRRGKISATGRATYRALTPEAGQAEGGER